MNIIVAISFAPIDRDPDILKQRAIFVFVLGGVRCANSEKRSILLDL
jgi:hypothetical protein